MGCERGGRRLAQACRQCHSARREHAQAARGPRPHPLNELSSRSRARAPPTCGPQLRNVVLLTMDTSRSYALSAFAANRRIRAAVIDGAHDERSVFTDIYAALTDIPCCVEVVVFHDYCDKDASEPRLARLSFCGSPQHRLLAGLNDGSRHSVDVSLVGTCGGAPAGLVVSAWRDGVAWRPRRVSQAGVGEVKAGWSTAMCNGAARVRACRGDEQRPAARLAVSHGASLRFPAVQRSARRWLARSRRVEAIRQARAAQRSARVRAHSRPMRIAQRRLGGVR